MLNRLRLQAFAVFYLHNSIIIKITDILLAIIEECDLTQYITTCVSLNFVPFFAF